MCADHYGAIAGELADQGAAEAAFLAWENEFARQDPMTGTWHDHLRAAFMAGVEFTTGYAAACQPEVTHACPPEGSGLMPCCDRTPFEVSPRDRMTLDPGLVTCTAACRKRKD